MVNSHGQTQSILGRKALLLKFKNSFHGRKENKEKSKKRIAGTRAGFVIHTCLATLLVGFAVFVACTIRWAFTTWSNLKMDEILYQLSNPLTGTATNIMQSFVTSSVVPAIIAAAAAALVFIFLRKKKFYRKMRFIAKIASACCIALSLTVAWIHLDFGTWLVNRNRDSSFIEDHYVDPSETQLTFPETKRNLIYIYLESMEDTYADTANGGGFDFNCIPELTALAEENEDFSGDKTTLNGSHAMNGATWTMGGLFAQTSGLPLKTSLGNNGMSTQSQFFPSITTLGDILKDQGYQQVFMLGSDATFGGRRLYFTEHGSYTIMDYNYAVNHGLIPEGYYVWWGYEDEKLFSFARDALTELGSSDQPFNFTMLTVDTHFTDGYVCELCPTTFGDNQYANVMACSSAQVAAFVEWCQQQSWYDNTTIVISGDHLTMDGDFCNDVSRDYDRKVYTCYINAAAEVGDPEKERNYTTFDDFPTTLAALGVKIDGDRLGLGTNLFSAKQTLTEKYGVSEMNVELSRKSSFMQNLSGVSKESLQIADDLNSASPEISVRSTDDMVIATITGMEDINDEISRLLVSFYNEDGERVGMYYATLQPDDSWYCAVYKTSLGEDGDYTIRLHVNSDAGDIYIGKDKTFALKN